MTMQLQLILSLLVAFCIAQAPFTALENHKLKRVGTPVISHSGKYAVYTLRQWDSDKNIATTSLQLLDLATEQTRQLTFLEGKTDYNPVFTNDDKKVLFLSSRGNGIYSVDLSGGQVEQIVQFPVPISDLKVSWEGKYFVFSAEVYVDCDTLECTAERDAKLTPSTPQVYTQLYIRHWDRWEIEGKMRHIFIAHFEDYNLENWKSVKPIDIMKDMRAASPNNPFGGPEMFDISPNGQMIAFTAEMINNQSAWTTGWRTFVVNVTRQSVSAPFWISRHTRARTNTPLFHPDGKQLAFVAMDRPGYEADRYHIEIYNLASHTVKKVAYNWDRSVESMVWSGPGKLLCTAQEDGSVKVFEVDVATGAVSPVLEEYTNHGVTIVPNSNTVLLQRSSYKFPDDIWRFSLVNGRAQNVKRITNANPHLSQFHMSEPERFYFTGAKNERVHAWVFKPRGFEQGKKYPVVQLIHGGPQGAWNDGWSYRWHPQLFTSAGFAVFAINFHGSTGFGQNFTDSINGNWGTYPYEDIIKGSHAVFANFPWIDKNRHGAAGASYGGFMTNWLNGHNVDNMFKALVTHCGVFDSIAMYFTTEELWFNEWEFKGTPWSNPYFYNKFNPREYVRNWKTPTLVIHGGRDFRVPISEGLGAFTALQRQGIPSKFVHFPTENHWVLSPLNSVEWYKHVLEWFGQWLK